jgi:hypothetical protein
MMSVNARRACRLGWLTACAWVALALYDAARIAGFGQVHAWTRRLRPSRRARARAEDVVWAVDEACVWYPHRVLCLQRSTVGVWLLRRHGWPAQLVLGYRPIPFESHAWVEIGGCVVNDRPQYRTVFAVLDRL